MRSPTSVIDRLAALGEMLRLRILRLLEAEELSVGEVSQVVQLPQSTVSRHLKILAEGGWIKRRSEGTATYYSMSMDDLAPEGRALWRAVREQMGEAAELAEDSRRLMAVLDERKTDSQAFFGRYSGEWDDLRTELFGGRFTSLALLSLIRPDWVVADLGCGTGNAGEVLAPAVERVVAVDRSGPMLSAARQRLAKVKNVDFLEGGLDRLPLSDASVDAAVCVLVLHHLDEPVSAVREMRRVLRADRGGGVGLVVDMVSHDRDGYRRSMGHKHLGFGGDTVGAMMHQSGFADVTYRELPGEPEAKGPGLFVARGTITKG